LAHGDTASENHVVTDADVPAKHRIVCEDHVTTDFAIMTDVRSHHEKAVITNFGDTPVILSACIHRHVFANVAIGTNNQPGWTATIAIRLRG
jgi:hypothetical protein